MKTVTATFTTPLGTTKLELQFETLPGMAPAKYEVQGEPIAPAMPEEFFAETYDRALRQFAKTHGAEIEIAESGEWEVFTE
jgi:hypothetical protein